MSEPVNLDAEAAALETRLGARCSVCSWIDARPEAEVPQWNALMEGPRTTPAIHKLMVVRGYNRSESAVGNCRRNNHRSAAA